MKIPIIYEDENILVISKPAGILVHPTSKNEKNTLIDWLISKHPEIKNIGDPSTSSRQERPGIVHRLDKDTSGLMIIAKNNKTFFYLKKQFQDRKIEKKYLALVTGKLKDGQGIITKTISRSKRKGRIQTTAPIGKRREAITRYKVLKEFEDYSLLEVMPETGRTHQIRVHLASIGHPIASDEKYKFKRQPCPKNLKRQFLHASYLKFKLLNGKIKEFKSRLPKELEDILRIIPNSPNSPNF